MPNGHTGRPARARRARRLREQLQVLRGASRGQQPHLEQAIRRCYCRRESIRLTMAVDFKSLDDTEAISWQLSCPILNSLASFSELKSDTYLKALRSDHQNLAKTGGNHDLINAYLSACRS